MKKTITLIFLLILLVMIFLYSNILIPSILEYTDNFFKNLFPYSFIIFTISSMLIDYDLINLLNHFHLNGAKSYVTVMSILSGFPSGAKYTKELLNKNIIQEDEANYLITYTSYPNPLFILGSVSKVITKSLAIKLLISIYLSSFIVSRIFKIKSSSKYNNISKNTTFTASLSKAINDSIKTLIIIYGTSVFFFIISFIVNNLFNTTSITYCLTNGFFDLTKGIFSTTILNDKRIRAILILLFTNFTSLSIHMQVKTLLDNTKIKYSSYFKGRLFSTIISLTIFMLISNS